MRTLPKNIDPDATAFLVRQYQYYLILDDTSDDDLVAFLGIAHRLIARGALPKAEAEAITAYLNANDYAAAKSLGECEDTESEPDEDMCGEGEANTGPGFLRFLESKYGEVCP